MDPIEPILELPSTLLRLERLHPDQKVANEQREYGVASSNCKFSLLEVGMLSDVRCGDCLCLCALRENEGGKQKEED